MRGLARQGVYENTNRQYNAPMNTIAIVLVIVGVVWPSMLLAVQESPSQVPGFNERLNQALGSEAQEYSYQSQARKRATVETPTHGETRGDCGTEP